MLHFAHTATDERENINAVMQHIGMETCIRFKDLSEDDDAEQNQEYDDTELGPVYAEDNNNTDVFSPTTKINVEDEENLTTAQDQKVDDTVTDQQLRQGTSDTKNSHRTQGSSTTEGRSPTRGNSTAQTQDHKHKMASMVQSATTPTEPPKVTKHVPKQNSSNIKRELKKPTSKLKHKKLKKLKHNDKQSIDLTSKDIKRIDKKAAAQKPGKKIAIFYFDERLIYFNV